MCITFRAAASCAEVNDVDPSDQFRDHRLPSPCTSDHLVAKQDYYGVRAGKLMQMMQNPNSGELRRRFTMDMPIYQRNSSIVAPIRGMSKSMSSRREKVRPYVGLSVCRSVGLPVCRSVGL